MAEVEPQPQPSSLPIVPAQVKDHIIEDMGGEHPTNSNLSLEIFSENVFADVLNSNRDFARAINELLIDRTANEKPEDAPLKQNAYINGMAVVIKAFDYTQNFDLVPRFANLKPDDIALTKQTLEKFLSQKGNEKSILQKLLTASKIPEQQISLNECINKAKRSSVFVLYGELDAGATAMYETLGVLWPKLYPPQTPPSSSAQT